MVTSEYFTYGVFDSHAARSVESPVEAFLLTRFRPAAKLVPTQSLLLHALDGGAHWRLLRKKRLIPTFLKVLLTD